MMPLLSRKEFYKILLRDRFPIVKIDFPTEKGNGRVEFINTPLGVVLHIYSHGEGLKEIKMYDKMAGRFVLQNVFCGDNLVCLDDGSYVSISRRLQIEDVIGRSFLIKLDDMSIIARAEFVQRRRSNIDKSAGMVYN